MLPLAQALCHSLSICKAWLCMPAAAVHCQRRRLSGPSVLDQSRQGRHAASVVAVSGAVSAVLHPLKSTPDWLRRRQGTCPCQRGCRHTPRAAICSHEGWAAHRGSDPPGPGKAFGCDDSSCPCTAVPAPCLVTWITEQDWLLAPHGAWPMLAVHALVCHPQRPYPACRAQPTPSLLCRPTRCFQGPARG